MKKKLENRREFLKKVCPTIAFAFFGLSFLEACSTGDDSDNDNSGGNDQNGLGLNTPTYRSSPAQLPGSWSNISSGAYGAAAVKTDGTLWAWGNNSFGILGQNSEGANFSSPKQVGTDTDWTFASMGEYNLTGFKVS